MEGVPRVWKEFLGCGGCSYGVEGVPRVWRVFLGCGGCS